MILLWCAVGLALAALLFELGTLAGEIRQLRDRLRIALAERDVATERLYAAWSEGKQIPAPEVVAPTELPEPIPSELRELVDQWESPDSRVKAESEIRALLSRGLSPAGVLRHFERPNL